MTTPNNADKELRERLAAIEHERWADWQKWLHGKLKNHFIQGDDGSLIGTGHKIMNEKDFEHWERQINTPYSELSDKEKASDMEQVDRYWDLLLAWRDREVVKTAVAALQVAKHRSHSKGFPHEPYVLVEDIDEIIAELEANLKQDGEAS